MNSVWSLAFCVLYHSLCLRSHPCMQCLNGYTYPMKACFFEWELEWRITVQIIVFLKSLLFMKCYINFGYSGHCIEQSLLIYFQIILHFFSGPNFILLNIQNITSFCWKCSSLCVFFYILNGSRKRNNHNLFIWFFFNCSMLIKYQTNFNTPPK